MEKNLPIDEAVRLLIETWPQQMTEEQIPIGEGLGRTLSRPQFAASDIPVVRAAGMDGVCVKSALFRDGRAIAPETWQLGREYDFADMGDDFPNAYDTVIAIERVKPDKSGTGIQIDDSLEFKKGMCVIPAGRFVKKDQKLMDAPTVLHPTDLAAIAMGNNAVIPVYRKPKVAFLPTGSELIAPGEKLGRGQNVDSNSLLVRGLLLEYGAEPHMYSITRDACPDLKKKLFDAIDACDLVIVNGGSSKGKEDLALGILEEEGDLLFHWVQCGPGRPTALARVHGKPVMVVPGPSYGCLNVMDWFVRPVIAYWLHLPRPNVYRTRAILEETADGPRQISFLQGVELSVNAEGKKVARLLNFKQHGAARCLAADGMLRVTPAMADLAAGSEIEITLLRES